MTIVTLWRAFPVQNRPFLHPNGRFEAKPARMEMKTVSFENSRAFQGWVNGGHENRRAKPAACCGCRGFNSRKRRSKSPSTKWQVINSVWFMRKLTLHRA
jgi:hypothetical protein